MRKSSLMTSYSLRNPFDFSTSSPSLRSHFLPKDLLPRKPYLEFPTRPTVTQFHPLPRSS